MRGLSALLLIAVVLLESCGGGGDNKSPMVVDSPARLIGVEGLPYASGTHTRGITDPQGTFQLEQDVAGSCANGSCSPTIDFGVTFTLCGIPLPSMPESLDDGFLTQYTLQDVVGTNISDYALVANNMQRLIMTANSRTGDPKNGITIADSVRTGNCPVIDLHTTDLAGQTAAFQALAPRPLVSALEANALLEEKFDCRNAGIFIGTQQSNSTSAALGHVSGAFNVFVNIDGQAIGSMDFNQNSVAPYVGVVPFSGNLGLASGGRTHFTVSEPAGLKDLRIDFNTAVGRALSGNRTSGDGTMTGTTDSSGLASVARVGFGTSYVPLYRFMDKNLTWTSPKSGPTSWALDLEIDATGVVKGALQQFPQGTEARKFVGSFANNILTANYTGIDAAGAPPLSLTFDSASTSLSGTLYGQDGTIIKTYTSKAKLPGCPL